MSKKLYWTIGILFCISIVLWTRILSASEISYPEVLFLPVGQGDSELIRVGDVTMLIDAGPSQGISSILDGIIGAGKRIDLVFVSHGDSDHVSGLSSILASRSVGAIMYSGTSTVLLDELFARAREQHVPVFTLSAGDRVSYASSTIEVLWPMRTVEAMSRNDTSLILAFHANEDCALFTGDIGFETEKDLITQYGNAIDCDVLKVAHHGSKLSSSAQFLNAVSPAVSIIEVGKNSYGHPTPEVLARLAKAGSGIWRTDQDGLVRVILKPYSLSISPSRCETTNTCE